LGYQGKGVTVGFIVWHLDRDIPGEQKEREREREIVKAVSVRED
jgi:hypothetical protein